MELRFIRHATLQLTYGGFNLLIDPMLSPAGDLEPVRNSPNQRRNPLADLPMTDKELAALIGQLDGVLVTHTHFDHWDVRAKELLAKDVPLLCQPDDARQIGEAGFTTVRPVDAAVFWRGIEVTRTGGQHGTGEIGRLMGPVSGFVLAAEGEPTVYIAGDTIWCDAVEQALGKRSPDVIVVNSGAAQFNQGDPITMTAEDVAQVCAAAPDALVVAVHMEAINHCLLSRRKLGRTLDAEIASGRLLIPADGWSQDIAQ